MDRWKWVVIDVGVILDTPASHSENVSFSRAERGERSKVLADVSRITPTSITTHFHLSKSSHLPYREKSKIAYVLLFLRKFLLNDPVPYVDA